MRKIGRKTKGNIFMEENPFVKIGKKEEIPEKKYEFLWTQWNTHKKGWRKKCRIRSWQKNNLRMEKNGRKLWVGTDVSMIYEYIMDSGRADSHQNFI